MFVNCCPNCKVVLRENAKYCEYCGKKQIVGQYSYSRQIGNQNQLHCPMCKSPNIVHIISGQSSDGTGAAIGLNSGFMIGGFNSKTTNEYAWLCKNCGITFERIGELDKKLSYYKAVQGMAIFCAIVAIIATVYALIADINSLMWVTIPCVIVFAIIFGISKAIADSIAYKRVYLEQNCFD